MKPKTKKRHQHKILSMQDLTIVALNEVFSAASNFALHKAMYHLKEYTPRNKSDVGPIPSIAFEALDDAIDSVYKEFSKMTSKPKNFKSSKEKRK